MDGMDGMDDMDKEQFESEIKLLDEAIEAVKDNLARLLKMREARIEEQKRKREND